MKNNTSKRSSKKEKPKKTLIVIPAYNEEKNIEKVIKGIKENLKSADILVKIGRAHV